MILDWFNGFVNSIGDLVTWLSNTTLFGNVKLLGVIVAVAVSLILVRTFVGRAG